jgi:geranylgeranyl reductase family protein
VGDGAWDVVVVGAGPAGSAAALSALRARPDARVLLLDRAPFPRDKACGDGVAPQALDVLGALGVPGLVDDFPPVHRLRLGYRPGDGAALVGTSVRPSRVVPRVVLDARLRDAAVGAGAVPGHRRVRTFRTRPDCVVLDGEVLARVVVAADGAGSVLRRALGLRHNAGRHLALAIRGYAPVLPHLADEQRIVLGRGRIAAYAWSFPVGDGRANVGYGEVLACSRHPTRTHLLDRLAELLPGAGTEGVGWRAHHLPLSTLRPRQPDGRVLLAGDALSLVNPLTGEGIYYAVLSGACAGVAAVSSGDPGRTYRAHLAHLLGRHLRHTAAAARLARSPALVDAVLRAGDTDPEIFDALTELGLGRGLLTPRVLARAAVSVRSR